MKRNILLIFIGILFIINSHEGFGQGTSAQPTDKIRTVVIDAGHGGKDPGTLGKYTKEKDIALKVALKTGGYIQKYFPDVKVIYTRKTDKFIELHRRAQIANDANADLFISIHCNSVQNNPRPYGSETYIMGLHKSKSNLDVAKRENAAILGEDNTSAYQGFDPTSPDSYIIFNLLQDAYQDKSTNLADKIQSQFKNRVGRKSRGVKQAGFLVLHRAYMPRVLIELGFLSNPNEEKFLHSTKGQDYMASAIYRAFKEYKIEHDKRNDQADHSDDAPATSGSTGTAANESKPSTTVSSNNTPQNDDIVYRVQFTINEKKLPANHKSFAKLDNIFAYKQGKYWKYTCGYFNSFYKAQQHRNNIAKSKYKDAFVVAFKDGKRMKIQDARKATNEL